MAFVDLAQSCAPMVHVKTLAGVVSLESQFQPFGIRINSGMPLAGQPTSKAEAIAVAMSLVADNQDIQMGLGGIGVEELRKLNLSISDAFDACKNLKATATLLDGYYRLALKAGAGQEQAGKIMLQSYYGRDDPTVVAMVEYDQQVREETARLSPKLTSLTIDDRDRTRAITTGSREQPVLTVDKRAAESVASSWDVFSTGRRSSILVFQHDQLEQSE